MLPNRAARGRYYVRIERSTVESNQSCKPPSNHICIQETDVQQQWWVVSIIPRKACLLDFLPPCVRNEAEWLALWETCYLMLVLPLHENYTPVCFSFTIHTKTSLLTLLVTKCMECFSPQQAILCDTSCATCNLTRLWHYLLGDSIRSWRLRVQSHKTALTSFQTAITNN